MARPLVRPKLFTADYVHGKDGLSDLNLPYPPLSEAKGHAMDAIIDTVMQNPGEIEIVTLGPLTNLAMAYLKEPRIAENVKKVYIMGATGMDQGNATPPPNSTSMSTPRRPRSCSIRAWTRPG